MDSVQLEKGNSISKRQKSLKEIEEKLTSMKSDVKKLTDISFFCGNVAKSYLLSRVNEHGDKELRDMLNYEVETFLDRSARLIENYCKKLDEEFEQI